MLELKVHSKAWIRKNQDALNPGNLVRCLHSPCRLLLVEREKKTANYMLQIDITSEEHYHGFPGVDPRRVYYLCGASAQEGTPASHHEGTRQMYSEECSVLKGVKSCIFSSSNTKEKLQKPSRLKVLRET